jgi:methyltransferase (TIGR00027 family)
MEAGRHSITALHAAFMRAHHAAHARPTIFADTYAHLMLSASERKSIETRLLEDLHRLDPTLAEASPDRQTALAVAMRALPSPAHIIVRARYAEDALAEAIPHGLRSYVIIGAGMDTFALRHLELHGRLQVVELDHPATQAFKRQRVAEVGLQTSPHLRFVPVDLEREDLAAVLARLAFEPGVPVFCSWLGVAAYLSQTAILDTLQAISRATPAGSHLVFDQIRPGVLADRAQFFTDLSAPFYGANRPGA